MVKTSLERLPAPGLTAARVIPINGQPETVPAGHLTGVACPEPEKRARSRATTPPTRPRQARRPPALRKDSL